MQALLPCAPPKRSCLWPPLLCRRCFIYIVHYTLCSLPCSPRRNPCRPLRLPGGGRGVGGGRRRRVLLLPPARRPGRAWQPGGPARGSTWPGQAAAALPRGLCGLQQWHRIRPPPHQAPAAAALRARRDSAPPGGGGVDPRRAPALRRVRPAGRHPELHVRGPLQALLAPALRPTGGAGGRRGLLLRCRHGGSLQAAPRQVQPLLLCSPTAPVLPLCCCCCVSSLAC
jgi:hypothetical protein